jgi:hypothetical protein
MTSYTDYPISKESEIELLQKLERNYGKLKVQRIESGISYIGFLIERDKSNGDILLSMPKHIEQLLNENNIMRTTVTPATNELLDYHNIDNTPCDRRKYLSILMSTYYIGNRFRYDLLFSLSTLATKCKNPTQHDMKCLIRLLQYLKMTQKYKQRYKHFKRENNNLDVRVYIDASHGIHSDYKGHTGLIVVIVGIGVIVAKSWKQKFVGTSTTHTELIGL